MIVFIWLPLRELSAPVLRVTLLQLKFIHGKMAIGKNILTLIEKAQIRDNLQVCVLYDIIKTWLLFNDLQRMVVEETFYYTITVRRNQCSNRNQQLLVYVKIERKVGKSQVVKVIYMGFIFLERQSKLFFGTSANVTAASIDETTYYSALSLDDSVWNKKQKTIKTL